MAELELTLPSGVSRCQAQSKQRGQQCGNPSMQGSSTCRFHGSAAPQVRRRAQLRLMELVDPALGRMARVLLTGKDSDALKAAEMILNRTGFPAKVELDVDTTRELLVERILALKGSDFSELSSTIDAEIVDDDNTDQETA